jgi:hypothetical protein
MGFCGLSVFIALRHSSRRPTTKAQSEDEVPESYRFKNMHYEFSAPIASLRSHICVQIMIFARRSDQELVNKAL